MNRELRIPAPWLMWQLSRDPLGTLSRLHQRHGPFIALRSARALYPLIQPEVIEEVLVTHSQAFVKGRGLELARRLLGNGLLTANGEQHLRQRRLMQPAFQKHRLEGYGRTMVATTREHVRRWRAGDRLCLSRAMMSLTLDIITRTMFGEAIGDRQPLVEQALNHTLERFQVGLLPLIPLLERLPLPANRRFERARQQLDGVIFDLIARRRQHPQAHDDLLNLMVQAVDEGQRMSDQQLRDEALTIFLAGHETTANWLSWCLALLLQHPRELELLQMEIEHELGGRPASLADLERLPRVRHALMETLRLYPPAWIIGRKAIREVRLGERLLAPDSMVFICTWALHRQPEVFPQPESFQPERWARLEADKSLPRFAFLPFGAGNRVCIGEHFARTEATLILITLLQHWSFQPLQSTMPLPDARITLRPKGGLPVRLLPPEAPGISSLALRSRNHGHRCRTGPSIADSPTQGRGHAATS